MAKISYPIGNKSGAAVPVGGIGEVISIAPSGVTASTPAAATWYDDASTITLTAGTWFIVANVSTGITGAGVTSSIILPYTNIAIRTSASVMVAQCPTLSAQVNGITVLGSGTVMIPVTISSTTTYKFSVTWQANSGAPATPTSIKIYANEGKFFAIRLA